MSCVTTFTLHRAKSYVTLHLITKSTGTFSLSSTLSSSHVPHPLPSEHIFCGDPRPHLNGSLAEPQTFTGNVPKQLAEEQGHRHFTEDKQFFEHEDLRAESIATPLPDSDLDDEELRVLLASPLYLQEREEDAERSQVNHSER